MKRLLAGAVALAAGIVTLVVAHAHRPVEQPDFAKAFRGQNVLGILTLYKPGAGTAWSVTAYDAVHITGVVLASLGGAAVLLGLISIAHRLVKR